MLQILEVILLGRVVDTLETDMIAKHTIWIRVTEQERDDFKRICAEKYGEPMSRIFREKLLKPFLKKNGGKNG